MTTTLGRASETDCADAAQIFCYLTPLWRVSEGESDRRRENRRECV